MGIPLTSGFPGHASSQSTCIEGWFNVYTLALVTNYNHKVVMKTMLFLSRGVWQAGGFNFNYRSLFATARAIIIDDDDDFLTDEKSMASCCFLLRVNIGSYSKTEEKRCFSKFPET